MISSERVSSSFYRLAPDGSVGVVRRSFSPLHVPSPCFGPLHGRDFRQPESPQRISSLHRVDYRGRGELLWSGYLARTPALVRRLFRLCDSPFGALDQSRGLAEIFAIRRRVSGDGGSTIWHSGMGASDHRRRRSVPKVGMVGLIVMAAGLAVMTTRYRPAAAMAI